MRRLKRTLPQLSTLPLLLASCLIGGLCGCSSVPSAAEHSVTLLGTSLPPETQNRISNGIEAQSDILSDEPTAAYLAEITEKLLTRPNLPPPAAVRAKLVHAKNPDAVKTWFIPSQMIYFDVTVLKALHFENEIAAALALEIERVESYEFRETLEIEPTDRFDVNKIYAFTELGDDQAVDRAVDRLYLSGYDPRGIVAYLNRISSLKATAQVISAERIPLMRERAQRAIASYSPLKNPIVRTDKFYQIQKRLSKL